MGYVECDDRRLKDWSYNVQVAQLLAKLGIAPSEEETKELEDSVAKDGVRKPIILWERKEGEYLIVSGRRRRAAARKASRRPKSDRASTLVPCIFREFESDFAARIFVLSENDPRLAQQWDLTQPERLALAFDPNDKKTEIIYRNLKSNYAYADLEIDPATATAADRERARALRIRQREEQQAARAEAAQVIGASPESLIKSINHVQRRFFPKPERPKKKKLSKAEQKEGFVIFEQRDAVIDRLVEAEEALKAQRDEVREARAMLSAIDRRLGRLAGERSLEDLWAMLGSIERPVVTTAEREKLEIKQPVVNRRDSAADKGPARPTQRLLDLLPKQRVK